MKVAKSRSTISVEFLFVIITMLTLSAALNPLFYTVFGARSAAYTESNPARLLTITALYAIAGTFALYRFQNTRLTVTQSPLLLAIFLLPLLSLAWTVDPGTTFRRAVAHLLTGSLCIYLASNISPEELVRRLVLTFFIGCVASLAYVVIAPSLAIHQLGPLSGSWEGVYGHKNELGRISAIAIIVATYAQPLTNRQRWLRISTIVISLFLLVMSQSRTNWFILSAMLAVGPMTSILRSKRISSGLRIGFFLFGVIALILMVTVGADAILSASGRDLTFSGRTTLWRGVNAVVAEKYPYLGAGYGAFFTEKGGIWDMTAYLTGWDGVPNHAHSGYLNTRADLGVPGVVLLAIFIVASGFRLVTKMITEPERPIWACFFGLLFLFVVNNFSETVAFKHSDIAWALALVTYCYAAPARAKAARPVTPRGAFPRALPHTGRP